jgi:hypothetical protein
LTITALASAPDGGFVVGGASHVWRVGPDGGIAVVAGNGKRGLSGDGGPATAARLEGVDGLAAMPDGGFLIADRDNGRVRRVWPDGHISTVAGTGPYTDSSGDGGPATAAGLIAPGSVAALPDGGFLIGELLGNRVRRVWPDGHISTVAGTGDAGFSGDGGPATAAKLASVTGVAALPDGSFVIADSDNHRVRRVWPDGHISTVAGGGAGHANGKSATAVSLGDLYSVAALPDGGFVLGEQARFVNDVRRVWPDGHTSTVIAGDDLAPAFFGDGGPAATASGVDPGAVAALPDGGILTSAAERAVPPGPDAVRLVIGPRDTNLLLAGIRPISGVALKDGYRLRLALSEPARVTVRLYHSWQGRPVAATTVVRAGGESTITIKARHPIPTGLYAVEVRASAGSQTTRALAWVYLGGKLTQPFVHTLQSKGPHGTPGSGSHSRRAIAAEQGPPPPTSLGCHQFSSTRIDCAWTYDTVVSTYASFLTPQGQIYTREYPGGPQLRPRWRTGRVWEDTSALWGPGGK